MPAASGEKNHTHIWTLFSPRYTLRGAWLHACGWWVGGWPKVCVQLATPAIRCDRARTAPDRGDHHGPLKERISLMQHALSRSLPFVVSGGSNTASRTTDYLHFPHHVSLSSQSCSQAIPRSPHQCGDHCLAVAITCCTALHLGAPAPPTDWLQMPLKTFMRWSNRSQLMRLTMVAAVSPPQGNEFRRCGGWRVPKTQSISLGTNSPADIGAGLLRNMVWACS